MNQVIVQSYAIDQDVVKEYSDEVTEIWPKNIIHCRLK